jgi:hypothetical protein
MLKARFQQLSNDLYWSLYLFEPDEHLKWIGYDDYYWWDKVSKSEQFRVKTSKSGTRYQLDPETHIVTVLK